MEAVEPLASYISFENSRKSVDLPHAPSQTTPSPFCRLQRTTMRKKMLIALHPQHLQLKSRAGTLGLHLKTSRFVHLALEHRRSYAQVPALRLAKYPASYLLTPIDLTSILYMHGLVNFVHVLLATQLPIAGKQYLASPGFIFSAPLKLQSLWLRALAYRPPWPVRRLAGKEHAHEGNLEECCRRSEGLAPEWHVEEMSSRTACYRG